MHFRLKYKIAPKCQIVNNFCVKCNVTQISSVSKIPAARSLLFQKLYFFNE